MWRAFGVLLLAVAMYFTYAIHWSVWRQNEAHRRFRPVTAEVVSARVRSTSAGTGSSRTTSYIPEIEYRYTVEGRQYTSDKFRFMGAGHGSYGSAAAVANAYPVGKAIPAYYDPDDPAVAVLDRSPIGTTMLYGVTGGVWATILGVCGYALFESRARRRAKSSVEGSVEGAAGAQ